MKPIIYLVLFAIFTLTLSFTPEQIKKLDYLTAMTENLSARNRKHVLRELNKMKNELIGKRNKFIRGYHSRRTQRTKSNRSARNSKNRFCSIASSVRRNNAKKAANDKKAMKDLMKNFSLIKRSTLEFVPKAKERYGARDTSKKLDALFMETMGETRWNYGNH